MPQHLCASIPAAVSDEAASFTVLSAIGLQGMRLAKPTLGETFVVSGLGLIGLLTAQLLRLRDAACWGLIPILLSVLWRNSWVLASQPLLRRRSGGLVPGTHQWHRRGWSVDHCRHLLESAGACSCPGLPPAWSHRAGGRHRSGAAPRSLLQKELSFQVSCSYGPGRYDQAYEQQGHDYPIGFVRWTEQRNFQAVLHALASTGRCAQNR